MSNAVHIVDLFSGPGGLGEGFSSCRDENDHVAYQIQVSIEKEQSAHKTLRLRSFLRKFDVFPEEYYAWIGGKTQEPDWKHLYPEQWHAADDEALCMELGKPETTTFLNKRIEEINKEANGRTLLIGGPPCQAYSLVGRSRRAGIEDYKPQKDERNFLYREYCKVLNTLKPAVFVMENVKGMLSSSIKGKAIFEQVLDDLEKAGDGYRLLALSGKGNLLDRPDPRDFVIHAEDYGVPQARHRVIIVGVKRELATRLPKDLFDFTLVKNKRQTTAEEVLHGLPCLRSGLSRKDNPDHWLEVVTTAANTLQEISAVYPGKNRKAYLAILKRMASTLSQTAVKGRMSTGRTGFSRDLNERLKQFLDDNRLVGVSGHETRGHMASDLARYMYVACFAEAEGSSPRAKQFPEQLAPAHKNWHSGKFNDRFRVQVGTGPSTTVTSHISKDGHYFIHPDANQCRSLTVREAARLQTFPDNYHFMGNRTQQFVQVGNAVPPFLARQIAELLLPVFQFI
ncbi:DNA cytosine methyltransferase [Cohaesibacter marisflavi]|uniref:DNA cytosine methyltransferase n=1 Tax=Cohaesibacter marisflavi TaxID=655353 RepID=UPI0029C7BFDD|nr:DNA cytosine methyltransferase [Cohaesibacter marisflavi]